jgi:RNA recognition motif-containing protein
MLLENRHRGFAFVTFTSQQDAQDAIDNMDMNELEGRVLKVSLARPQKVNVQGAGNRAGASLGITLPYLGMHIPIHDPFSLGVRRMVKAACKAAFRERWCERQNRWKSTGSKRRRRRAKGRRNGRLRDTSGYKRRIGSSCMLVFS